MFIYHIAVPEVWERYAGGPTYQPDSYAAEGFIHCSYEHQLDAVLERYYSQAGRVLVVKIERDKLGSELVEEPSPGGEIYPHIYGPLDLDAVAEVSKRSIP